MKEKEIKVDFKEQELIVYAEKDDDSIGPIVSGSYMAKNHLADFYYIWGNLEKELIGKLLKREISPIARFKELQELTISELTDDEIRKEYKAGTKSSDLFDGGYRLPVVDFLYDDHHLQDGGRPTGESSPGGDGGQTEA